MDKTPQIRLELQLLVESITLKIKDKVVRFEKPNTLSWNQNSAIDAIFVEPEQDILLTGIGLHRPKISDKQIAYNLAIYMGEDPSLENKLLGIEVVSPFFGSRKN